ncbi:MAG: winged helix DNA-binding domain-containing protein, partial [Paracoccaceae bacterium]|nr:winged helix DNA-binding domain-containing protein [Paracoccaceae bacterium]
ARALKLFGFNYRIEVFVPKENRIYGYYVFPILKGDALIGRIDAKADRQNKQLNVRAFWPEQSVKPIPKLVKSLEVALQDCAAFAGLDQIVFAQDWLRSAP